MIPAAALDRLLRSLVSSIVEPDEGDPARSMDNQRELLADFAGLYGLDLQDFATLVRIASGEATDGNRS